MLAIAIFIIVAVLGTMPPADGRRIDPAAKASPRAAEQLAPTGTDEPYLASTAAILTSTGTLSLGGHEAEATK